MRSFEASRAVPLCVFVVLLLWRLIVQSPLLLFRDWGAIIAAFGIVALLRPEAPALPRAAVAVSAYLLGLYVLGQGPHLLVALGCRP